MARTNPAHAAYGLPTASESEHRRDLVGVLLPLLTVVALAAVAIWFVALPALEQPPPRRSCEVIVLETGSTKCVESTEIARKAGRASRA